MLCFAVHLHVEFGQEVRACGGIGLLGNWDVSQALSLIWSPNDIWLRRVCITTHDPSIEFKYVICEAETGKFIRWESDGPNRCIDLNYNPLLHASIGPSSSAPGTTLNIGTYNIRYDISYHGGSRQDPFPWTKRCPEIAVLVEDMFDVVGFQEPLKHQVDSLLHMLPGFDWTGQGRYGPSADPFAPGNEYSPVFYRKSRVELLFSYTVNLSEDRRPGSVALSWQASLPRIATVCEFVDRVTRIPFTFINTHLDHMSIKAREKASLLLLKILSEHATLLKSTTLQIGRPSPVPSGSSRHCPPIDPMIIVGDFNCDVHDRELQPFLAGQIYEAATGASSRLYNARALCHPTKRHGPSSTFTEWNHKAEGITIDHIFVSEGVEIVHTTVSEKLGPNFLMLSDHRPLVAELDFVKNFASNSSASSSTFSHIA